MTVPAATRPTAMPEEQGGRAHDHLLERLHHLRTIVPVFAQELASAKRQTAHLRAENRRLTQEVRRLQRQRRARSHSRATMRENEREEPAADR